MYSFKIVTTKCNVLSVTRRHKLHVFLLHHQSLEAATYYVGMSAQRKLIKTKIKLTRRYIFWQFTHLLNYTLRPSVEYCPSVYL